MGTDALLKLRSEQENRRGYQGIGYFVPGTVTREQWKRLRKHWDKILRNSGHDEIEQFSTDCTGHFTPFFVKTRANKSVSGSSASAARDFDPFTQEYYRRVGIFRHHAPVNKLFKGKVVLIKHILKLLADGATYEAVARYFNSSKVPKGLRKKRTYFFAYHHIERPTNRRAINRVMAQWFKDNPEYLE